MLLMAVKKSAMKYSSKKSDCRADRAGDRSDTLNLIAESAKSAVAGHRRRKR